MKQYTHAWLAFMAMKRLEYAELSKDNRCYAENLINWFKSHKDGVVHGAWYPDALIKDMANSHVLKFKPYDGAAKGFRSLPLTYLSYRYGKKSPVRGKAFIRADKHDNLPTRCEAIAHSVVDLLKVQESEEKGSPVSPTGNLVAQWLFMLSHYVADAHMPFHCDGRKFSKRKNIHGKMEKEWDDDIRRYYKIDADNERFFYDEHGYPLRNLRKTRKYESSFLKRVDNKISQRKFILSYGKQNQDVWDFMSAVCQHSYLLSYCFLPEEWNHANVTLRNWKSRGNIGFEELSVAVFSDAIDSIARIWFRVWRRYEIWKKAKLQNNESAVNGL